MAVKIRLKRLGKIRAPYYRIVVADSRTKRDGRVIEEIGKYHPTEEPSFIEVDSERAQYWLGVGAQPTEQVAALLKITGDWQKFKGLPGQEGTLRVAEPKADEASEAAKELGASSRTPLSSRLPSAEKAEGRRASPRPRPPEPAEARPLPRSPRLAADGPSEACSLLADAARAPGPGHRRPPGRRPRRAPRRCAAATCSRCACTPRTSAGHRPRRPHGHARCAPSSARSSTDGAVRVDVVDVDRR